MFETVYVSFVMYLKKERLYDIGNYDCASQQGDSRFLRLLHAELTKARRAKEGVAHSEGEDIYKFEFYDNYSSKYFWQLIVVWKLDKTTQTIPLVFYPVKFL